LVCALQISTESENIGKQFFNCYPKQTSNLEHLFAGPVVPRVFAACSTGAPCSCRVCPCDVRVGTDGFDGSAFRRARCEQHNADHARFESTNHERNVPRDAVFWLGNHDIFSDDLTVFIGLFSVWCVATCNFMFLVPKMLKLRGTNLPLLRDATCQRKGMCLVWIINERGMYTLTLQCASL